MYFTRIQRIWVNSIESMYIDKQASIEKTSKKPKKGYADDAVMSGMQFDDNIDDGGVSMRKDESEMFCLN